jgi:hypothetical protein
MLNQNLSITATFAEENMHRLVAFQGAEPYHRVSTGAFDISIYNVWGVERTQRVVSKENTTEQDQHLPKLVCLKLY